MNNQIPLNNHKAIMRLGAILCLLLTLPVSCSAIVDLYTPFDPDTGNPAITFSPVLVRPGDTFLVNSQIHNSGDTAAGNFYVDYCLSTDQTMVVGDEYWFGGTDVFGVPAGAYVDIQATGTFPSDIPPGQYYLGVWIDYINSVDESNKNNNKGISDTRITVFSNYLVPTISSISPKSANIGSSGFTLMVLGQNFYPTSIVRWNGANRATTFVSANRLDAAILPGDLTTGGTRTVTVYNPAPGGGISNGKPFNVTRKNVWMFYVCGDNELDPSGMLQFIHNSGGSDKNVTIIAMVDNPDSANPPRTLDDGIYYISGSVATDVKLWTPPTELSMGDPTNLAFFINYVTTNYPSDRYMITLWDHGSGYRGVLSDDDPGSGLSIEDLGAAIESTGVHFDLLQFEACMMGMAEVGYELHDNVSVMVASEEVDYMSRPYTEILQWFKQNPTASSVDLGKKIVDGYFDRDPPPTRGTLAVIDLTKMHMVATSLDHLGDLLIMNMPQWRQSILKASLSTQRYYLTDYADMLDFMDKLDNQISDPGLRYATWSVRANMVGAVPYERDKGSDLQDSHGLSVWIFGGSTSDDSFSNNLDVYRTLQMASDTSWDEFNVEFMKTDFGKGVFRPSSTDNWILDRWRDGSIDIRNHYGSSSYIPLVGDFNNDGFIDRAVFSPPAWNNWIIDHDMDGSINLRNHYGQMGDIPMIGDFNNDGTLDRAVFRGSVYDNWLFDYSMDGTVNTKSHFGTSGDVPLVGDFNNDGTPDRAVFRASTWNNWIIDYGMNGVDTRNHYGSAGDIPVIGDFNADSITDRAVFRAGEWIIDYNMDGSTNSRPRFGQNGDIPLVWNP